MGRGYNGGSGKLEELGVCVLFYDVQHMMGMCVAMKRHGDDNEDKQPDKRPRLHQVTSHATRVHTLKHIQAKYNLTHQHVAQAQPGLVALPFALAPLLLSFLSGRAILSLLGVSHTSRQLCTCLHKLDLSSCEELDDVSFVLSLVRLRTLDLSDCSEQLVDVSPLSSLTLLNALYLGCKHSFCHGSVRNLAVSWM